MEKKKGKTKDSFFDLRIILIAVILSLIFTHFIAVRVTVVGDSMNETLQDGDQLLASRFVEEPDRFDVVITEADLGDGTKRMIIKRVIGLPGETVSIKNGKIYIDGEQLEEDTYGAEEIMDAGNAADGYTVPDGCYYLMGDNRNNSLDSRYIGAVDASEFQGIAVFRFYKGLKFL